MENNNRKALTKGLSDHQRLDKREIFKGSLIATIIAITPFLFNLYESVPNDIVWNTFLFTYESGYYQNAQSSMWVLITKLIPLLLILIWFFTNRHWWYHTLLIPISMYIYQIISMFRDEKFFDHDQHIYMLPTMIVVIPTIYLVRARMFNKMINASKSLEQLEEEFKASPKNVWEKIKQYF